MNKYKLIKEYPGSPKLGAIVELKNNGGYELENSTSYFMTKDKVENYPEFWEKVVEKDYEILSFKQDSSCSDLWTKFGHGWCRNLNGFPVTAPYSYNEILNNHLNGGIKYNIHSVKRLSDSEVFTVGDKIILNRSNNKREIHSFVLSGDSILICDNISIRNAMWCLSDIRKNKPLFTTEDGVNIYEGDKVSTVSLSTMELYTIDGRAGSNTTPAKSFKYFSTKEAAEEYILMNKPCLSVADICTYFDGQLSGCSNLFYLKKLAKSKL